MTQIGPNCTISFNLAYVKKIAASQGRDFNLTDFDPYNVAQLCGASLSPEDVKANYEAGQAEYIVHALQTENVAVPKCDLTKFESVEYAQKRLQCAQASALTPNVCDPSCNAAIDIVRYYLFLVHLYPFDVHHLNR